MKQIYLDHAAATPLDPRVFEVMRPYFEAEYYNPSAVYAAAQQVRGALDDARRMVARCLGARPAEIIFTAGGTEANNLAVSGVMRQIPDARMVTSAIEHPSVLEPAKQCDAAIIPVDGQGIVDISALEAMVDDKTVLVSIVYANSEIGTVQSIRGIGHMLAKVRRTRQTRKINLPLYFHTDAAHAANYLDLQQSRLGVDMMTLNGGKIYGPKQSGVLYVRGGVRLQPLIVGGGQEGGLRSGTENVAAAIGLARALELAQELRHEETRRLYDLQGYFIDRLSRDLPWARINGSQRKRLPNNLHITLPGTDNERLLFQLDAAGIMAAAGSACSASSEKPSHVLEAIGLSSEDARSSLRLTMGRSTDKAALDYTLTTLTNIVSRH